MSLDQNLFIAYKDTWLVVDQSYWHTPVAIYQLFWNKSLFVLGLSKIIKKVKYRGKNWDISVIGAQA